MNKFIVLAIVSFIILTSCKNNNNQEIIEDSNDVKNTIESITKKIRENPKNPDLFLQRAELYIQENDIKEAINDANIALRIDSLRPDIYAKIAEYNLLIGYSEDAKNILIRGIKNFPKDKILRLKLAYIYFYVQMYIDAMKEINYIEANNLQTTDSYFLKALILDETEMYQDAILALRTAIEYDNNNWEAYNRIGLIYGSLDDKMAVDYFTTAVKLFPTNLEIRYNAGVTFQKFGLFDNAISEYKYVIQADSLSKESHYNLGIIYVDNNKDYQLALKEFNTVIEIDSLYYKAFYNRGYTYEKLKNYPMAEKDFRQTLKIMPNFDLAIQGLNDIIDKRH